MRYALKLKASNLSGDNTAVVTFNTLIETADANGDALIAGRLYAWHKIMQNYGIMSSASVVGLTSKPNIAGLPTVAQNVPFSQSAYLEALGEWNDLTDRPGLLANDVDTSGVGGDAVGNAIYSPIGTSMMIAEQSTDKTGRIFVPFPQIINVCDFNTGKIRQDYQGVLAYVHGWLVGLKVTDPAVVLTTAMGVFSKTTGAASRITKVVPKSEFSNLASRRR